MIRKAIIFFLFFRQTKSYNVNNIKNCYKKVYHIEIDDNICYNDSNNYLHSIPDYKTIDKINKLYKHGYKINYWCNRNKKTGKNWTYFTEKQLKIWGVKYTTILMDEPNDIDNIKNLDL